MEKQSYVDLPAILAGTSIALAISLVLFHFGSVLGLTMSDASTWNDTTWEARSVAEKIIVINLWALWVQMLAAIVGGYITGRIRAPVAGASLHEREMRDGIHGLSVWGFGTVLVAVGAAAVAAIAATSPVAHENAQIAANVLKLHHGIAIISAFSMASVSLVSAVAGWWAATKGGEHRDEAIDLSHAISFRKKA